MPFTLLSPLALGLLTFAAPIVLLHMLRARRRRQVVSSTFLWRRIVEDTQVQVVPRRLRFSVVLLLQLLALIALVLALARPAYLQAQVYSGDVVLVIDQSYTMQARDVVPSRFAEAVRRAHVITGNLQGSSVMSVVGMGARPLLVVAASHDRTTIDRAIDSLRVGSATPNFRATLALIASLPRNDARTRVIVLTSRDSGISRLPFPVSSAVQIERIGGPIHDLGVSAFTATAVGGATQAVLRVRNVGRSMARSDLNLYVDGRLADVRPLIVRGDSEISETWDHLPLGFQTLKAQLAQRDDIGADNMAWTAVGTGTTASVLLVTNGDYFLETALSLDPSIRLRVIPPSKFSTDLARAFDLVVFDGNLPPGRDVGSLQTSPSVLLVAPPSGDVGPLHFGKEAPVDAAPAKDGAPSVLRYVDLSDVHVARARSVSLPAWIAPVVSTRGISLIAVGETNGHRLGIVTFNLQESDWPLRLSFPVAVHNLVRYLVPGLILGVTTLQPGADLRFLAGPGVRQIRVTLPDGQVTRIDPPFSPLRNLGESGIYVVQTVGGQARQTVRFAVNVPPPVVHPVAGPRDVLYGRPVTVDRTQTTTPIDLGWLLGCAALLTLAAEWWFSFR